MEDGFADPTEAGVPGAGPEGLRRVAALLGGGEVLQHPLETLIDAHDLFARGLLGAALYHLVDRLVVLDRSMALEQGLGISLDICWPPPRGVEVIAVFPQRLEYGADA